MMIRRKFLAYVTMRDGVQSSVYLTADCFVSVTQDVAIPKQFIYKYMTNERCDDIRDFNKFGDKYIKAIKKLRGHNKLV